MHTRIPRKHNLALKPIVARLKKHWAPVVIIVAALVITGLFLYGISQIERLSYNAVYSPKPRPQKVYSPLTGKQVANEAATTLPVTAVMIENSPDARPQSGLKEAGIVYEAVAEGGITRFIALYQQEKPNLIGPVRSLRMYYLDWAAPYQASIAHVGGSPNALSEVRQNAYRDIDQFFNSGAYWRASDRYAPHNVYTNAERLTDLNTSKGYTTSTFEGFARTDGKPAETANASSVTVNFSSALYNTSYAYNKSTNSYARSIAGAPHNDREHGQISPDALVVMRVDAQSRGGADGYEDIVTTGSGQVYVFQNGTVVEGTWKKTGRTSPLQLLGADSKPIELNRGQTWIGAITGRGSVSWE